MQGRFGLLLLGFAASASLTAALFEDTPHVHQAIDDSFQMGAFEGRRLLVTGNKRSALNTAKTCMAEDMCVAKACGKAYEQTASNFPFSIDYQKSTTSDATTFDFQVCAKQCTQESSRCDELAAWSIRLDTELVANSHFIQDVQPGGELLAECAETGLGYRWQGGALGALEGHHPSGGDRCQSYRVSIAHDPHMAGHYWLTDVCQQAIDVWAGKVGSSSFSQSNLVLRADKYSDVGACLVHFKLASGAYGFTMLEDKEYAERDRRSPEAAPVLQSGDDAVDDSPSTR